MGSTDVAAALRQLPPFADLAQSILERLVRGVRIAAFRKGDALFRQGDAARYLFVLLRGRVKVLRHGPTGAELICDLHHAPAVLGEFAAYTGEPHLMTTVALEPCHVALLDRQSLCAAIECNPALAARFLQMFRDRYAHLSAHLDGLTAGSVENRLACLLTRLRASERYVGLRRVVPLALTRREVADLLDTTTETVVRVLTKWKGWGIIATGKREIEVKQWGPVERLALGEAKAIDVLLPERPSHTLLRSG